MVIGPKQVVSGLVSLSFVVGDLSETPPLGGGLVSEELLLTTLRVQSFTPLRQQRSATASLLHFCDILTTNLGSLKLGAHAAMRWTVSGI